MKQNQVDLRAQAAFISKLNASSNNDAVATQAADTTQFWCIDWIAWSYDGTPTAPGKVTVAIGSTTVHEFDITVAGPGIMRYGPDSPLYNPLQTFNETVTITLAAGGSGVTGKVTARIR